MRKRVTRTPEQRENHRRAALIALDCPIRREIIAKSTAASWKDPESRARRIAALKKAWADPERRKKRIASLGRARLQGKFISHGVAGT